MYRQSSNCILRYVNFMSCKFSLIKLWGGFKKRNCIAICDRFDPWILTLSLPSYLIFLMEMISLFYCSLKKTTLKWARHWLSGEGKHDQRWLFNIEGLFIWNFFQHCLVLIQDHKVNFFQNLKRIYCWAFFFSLRAN